MSYIQTNIPSCPKIQEDLSAAFEYDPSLQMEGIAFVPYLKSPENTNGVLQNILNPRSGKKRMAELTYTQRWPEALTGNTHEFACTSTRDVGEESKIYEFGDQATSFNWKLDGSRFYESCKSFEEWFRMKLRDAVMVMDRSVETKTWNEIVPLYGKFAQQDRALNATKDCKTIQTINANGEISRNGVAELRYSANYLNYGAVRPYLIGTGEIDIYFNELESGCCANSGLDLGEFFFNNANWRLINSYRANEALGEDTFYMIRPAAVQMLTFNKFAQGDGNNWFDTETHKQMTITSPFSGMTYDMLLNLDCNNESGYVWNLSLAVTHQLAVMPSDMFCPGDNLEGVNMINKFEIVNA